MSLSIAITAGKTLARNERANNAKLNALGLPTMALSGKASTDQLGNDTVTADKLAFGAVYYTSASGTNTITLTASGHTITLVEGMIARFKVATDNTGAVDIVFGGSTKDLFRYYNSTTAAGVELAAGDLRAGQNCEIIYDGTRWQLLSTLASSQVVVGTDAGSTGAYVITPTPSVRQLADITGVPVVFKANTINTGAATIAVSGLAATAIVKSRNVVLASGDIKAGQWVAVTYDGTSFQLLSPVTQPSARTTVSVRQTVLGCSVSSSTGLPDFLALGAPTTSVHLQNCATTPLVVAFAYGHDDSGAVDYVTRCSTDGATWTGLGGTTTYYLYVDRNTSTGAITYGQTTNRPTYVTTSAVATGLGFHTYLINTGFMYEGTALSTAIQRVFVGEATTSGGAVASVTAYMPRGEFKSGADINAALTNSIITNTHQLGLTPRILRCVLVAQTELSPANHGYAIGDEMDQNAYGYSGVNVQLAANATTVSNRILWASYPPQLISSSPALIALVAADWKWRFYAWRGW